MPLGFSYRHCLLVAACPLLCSLLTASCSKVGIGKSASDVYLDCRGSVSVRRGGVLTDYKDQQIAMHIAGDKISFSGNIYLATDSVCDTGNAKDEIYFETSACELTPKTTEHVFGKLNKITGVLFVSYDSNYGGTKRSNFGDFVCRKVDPLAN